MVKNIDKEERQEDDNKENGRGIKTIKREREEGKRQEERRRRTKKKTKGDWSK